MSTATPVEKSAVNGIRTALGVGGVIALIAGIVIIFQPAAAAQFVTIIIAIYALIGGLVYAGLGIFAKSMSAGARIGHIVLGILFVIAAIVAFTNLGLAAASLAIFVAVLVGIMWIIEGIVSLTTLSGSRGKGWSIFFAAISIIAGLYLLFNALLGALVLWWLLGIMLVVIGITQIVRAFTWKAA